MDFLKKLSIKQLFKKHEIEVASLKFGEARLMDGSVVEFPEDVIMVGMPVMVTTDQGILPIPDGEYTLEDGTVFVIAGGQGLVESIVPAEAPSEEAAPEAPVNVEEPMADEESAPMNPKRIIESIVKESVFATSEQFNAFVEAQNSTIEAQNAKIAEQHEIINALFALVEKVVTAKPADKPAEEKPHTFKKEKKANPLLAQLIALKNNTK